MQYKPINIKYIVSFFLLLIPFVLLAQEKEDKFYAQTYYFDGDDVVFEFDSRFYKEATVDGSNRRFDFDDLDIEKVVVSGSFNNWSKKGWKMKKVGLYTYQLRKKVYEFNDILKWEFKFLINNRYWAEPGDRFKNKVPASDFWEDVYNLNIYNVRASDNGNVSFFLEGYPNAKQVILSGNFNGWNEQSLKMEKLDQGWGLKVDLEAGRYEYKFIVDGEWMHDPENQQLITNVHGTFNSILFVEKEIIFQLAGFEEASKVILAGSFNGWDQEELEMRKVSGGWQLSRKLGGGKHHYKFIVDGQWILDPLNNLREDDGSGNVNSVLLVQ